MNDKMKIWIKCWGTNHNECVNITQNDFDQLKAQSVITKRAGCDAYWFNGTYTAFRQFLIGRASI